MTLLYTFPTQFDAIYANRTLKEAGLDSQLMPVPRTVSASCGVCVVLPAEDQERIPAELWEKVRIDGVFLRTEGGWRPAVSEESRPPQGGGEREEEGGSADALRPEGPCRGPQ